MKSPYFTLDIITSALKRNYDIVQKAQRCISFGSAVVFEEKFQRQTKQAYKNVDTLRIMANKYYAKNTPKKNS